MSLNIVFIRPVQNTHVETLTGDIFNKHISVFLVIGHRVDIYFNIINRTE